MHPHRPKLWRRFQVKVLAPVILIMATLLVVTMTIVNHRISRQFETQATRALLNSDAVLQNSQRIRAKNLLQRYGGVPNEPRFKAVCQLAEPKTMRFLLAELVRESDCDFILFTTDQGVSLAAASRDAAAPESAPGLSVRRALDGEPNTDTAVVADKLFDIISIPVVVDGHVLGALTFGAPLSDTVAGEFRQLTGSEIVFLAHDRVAATTLQNAELNAQLVAMFDGTRSIQKATLAGEHYLALAGALPSLAGDRKLGYLLLSSYEGSLSALRQTQLTLLVVGLLGTGLSSAIVWVLVRKVTQPLRLLRDGAEAIGRGDFSQRVVVHTGDECAELADAFNQMTGNLETTIENLKKTKAQLSQSEKLSVIGEFVAGVAHELNNPLASVYGFAQMLQRGGGAASGKSDHYLDRILRESLRCHKIVQNLLSFARQTPPERKPVNLNDLVLTSLEILQYQLRTSNINVTTGLDDTLPAVIGDAHQIQQVFVNIINNARQAIESHRSSGKIHIKTETRDDRVHAEFRDDGPGITPENLEKIFTPFFTTKEAGKGTGLGLSLCYGIVQEHGGTLNVLSAVGEGATFVVEFPVAEGAAPSAVEAPAPSEDEPNASQRPGKRVLVVDDEEALRDLISDALTAERFDVDTASDGETALRKTRGAHYDLVVCDWKMPGLNGLEFYQQLKTTDPETASRFIFLTGDVVGAQKSLGNQVSHWLPKPFSLDELRAMVNLVAFNEEVVLQSRN